MSQVEEVEEFVPVEEPAPNFEVVEVDDFQVANPPAPQGIGDRLVGRFMGTDVDDPIPLTRAGSTAVGAIAGGVFGSRTPRMPGPMGIVVNPITGAISMGVVGAAAGAVAPEVGMAIGEAVGFLPQGTKEKSGLSPSELRTVLEGEILLELATGGGLAAVRLGGRAFSDLFTGTGKKGKEAAERAAQHNIALLPVQVGSREIPRGYVAVMGRFPIFGGVIRRRAQSAQDATREAITGLQKRIGPISAWNEVGEAIFKDGGELVAKTNELFSKQYEQIWRQADELGVTVTPKATVDKAIEIIDQLAAQTPAKLDPKAATDAGETLAKVRNFLVQEILPMSDTLAEGNRVFAKQNFRQMDGLISKIDQELAALEPAQKRFATELMVQLRQAAQLDMLQNVGADNIGDALRIAQQLKAVDQSFSFAMSSLFETAAANRFGSVQRRGLRSVGIERTTRTPVDELARIVVRTDSPQVIDELSRIISPETMSRISSKTIDDAYKRAFASGEFQPDIFARQLGLNDLTSPRAQSINLMLEKSGSELRTSHLKELMEASRAIADTEIPDVSSFIARRATIGGLRSIIGAVVPGMALASGAVAFGGASLLGALTFVGGGRLISGAISNPDSARFLVQVLDKEAERQVRRNAMLKVIRGGITALSEQGEIDEFERERMQNATRILMLELNNQVEQLVEDGVQQ